MNLGEKVTKVLSADPILQPLALVWFFDESAKEWRFLVATDDVTNRGPRTVYMRIRKLLERSNLLDKLPLRRVVAVSPSSPIISALRAAIKVPHGKIINTRLVNCNLFGLEISGAHIYQMNF